MTLTTRREFLAFASAASAAALLAGCSNTNTTSGSSQPSGPVEVRVGSLKGPTSMGIASFMDKAASGSTTNSYSFTVAASADEIVPSLIKGDLDIALVPANVASIVHGKTKGAVSVVDINTLGVLSVVCAEGVVSQFADLAGKTVIMTGKGATPEYLMTYLMNKAGIAGQVTLDFKSEATEVVSALSADSSAIGVLPQPFVTAATTKNPALKVAIDLNDAWTQYAEKGSSLLTGVTVARNDFINANPSALKEFIEGQDASVEAANSNPGEVAPLVVKAGILDNEAVVAKAIPNCHLVCITGSEMKDKLSSYLEALFSVEPSSVGGELPPDSFYHVG